MIGLFNSAKLGHCNRFLLKGQHGKLLSEFRAKDKVTGLTKTDFVEAVICPKRLWLKRYRPRLAKKSEDSEIRKSLGLQLHIDACRAYTQNLEQELKSSSSQDACDYNLKNEGDVEGVCSSNKNYLEDNLNEEVHELELGGAVANLTKFNDRKTILEKTAKAIGRPQTVYIYEAGFLDRDGNYCRTDILRRNKDTWELIDIKSGKLRKDVHIFDLSFQKYVIENSPDTNLKISKCFIGFIDLGSASCHKSNPKIREDHVLSSELLTKEETWRLLMQMQRRVLNKESKIFSEVMIGPGCRKPYPCEYLDFCLGYCPSGNRIEMPISILPKIRFDDVRKYKQQGIHDLRDIPEQELKSDCQKRVRKSHILGKPIFSSGLEDELATFKWPRFFLDFEYSWAATLGSETFSSKDLMPFLWVVFRCNKPLEKVNIEGGKYFYSSSTENLHFKFLTSLLDCVGEEGPIFAHNVSAEKMVMKRIIERPECAHLGYKVGKVIERMRDTCQLCRDHFYSPEMQGKYGLKNIANAIPTSINYRDLKGSVCDGQGASRAWIECQDPSCSDEHRMKKKDELIFYCKSDVLVMVDLLNYFQDNCAVRS